MNQPPTGPNSHWKERLRERLKKARVDDPEDVLEALALAREAQVQGALHRLRAPVPHADQSHSMPAAVSAPSDVLLGRLLDVRDGTFAAQVRAEEAARSSRDGATAVLAAVKQLAEEDQSGRACLDALDAFLRDQLNPSSNDGLRRQLDELPLGRSTQREWIWGGCLGFGAAALLFAMAYVFLN